MFSLAVLPYYPSMQSRQFQSFQMFQSFNRGAPLKALKRARVNPLFSSAIALGVVLVESVHASLETKAAHDAVEHIDGADTFRNGVRLTTAIE